MRYYKLTNIAISIDAKEEALNNKVAKTLKTSEENISNMVVLKRSIDARKKNDIKFIYSLGVALKNEKIASIYNLKTIDISKKYIKNLFSNCEKNLINDKKVVIVGAGPAGLFAALTLVEIGMKPIIIERGYDVDMRMESIENFQNGGEFNPVSNVQFGEGGAGTFSDGKLNTGTKSRFAPMILNEFIRFGANKEIAYISKPHIGTDVLRNVVKNIREYMKAMGAEVYFGTKAIGFKTQNGKLNGIEVCGEKNGVIDADIAILALGHSARDTFSYLNSIDIAMEQKSFSIGVRIEHSQEMINFAQYGKAFHRNLGAADYKLATHLDNGRGVYTFCMCPGGEVVCGSSEAGGIVTNGMSYHARNGKNANAALLTSVTPKDFASDEVLAGVEFQRKYEEAAYNITNSYRAPTQLLGDLRENKITKSFGNVSPTYKPGIVFADMRECLPNFAINGIIEGANQFARKIKGYDSADAVLTGVETRSSSPIRILRDDGGQASIIGIYPIGEGAGYAGGIMSAAQDGVKIAEKLILNSK